MASPAERFPPPMVLAPQHGLIVVKTRVLVAELHHFILEERKMRPLSKGTVTEHGTGLEQVSGKR